MTSSPVSIGRLPPGGSKTIGWVTSHPATRVSFAPALTAVEPHGVDLQAQLVGASVLRAGGDYRRRLFGRKGLQVGNFGSDRILRLRSRNGGRMFSNGCASSKREHSDQRCHSGEQHIAP